MLYAPHGVKGTDDDDDDDDDDDKRKCLPVSPSLICNVKLFRTCNLLVSPTITCTLDQILVMHRTDLNI
jgi:hypothetical protein